MSKANDIKKIFGKRVRTLRLEKGITSQMTLSHKAGLDRTYIGGVERGERNIGIENIEKLAKALGVKVEELFKS